MLPLHMTNKNVSQLGIQEYSIFNAITLKTRHLTTLTVDTVQAIELLIVEVETNNIPICE